MIANVAVPIPLSDPLDYQIPEDLISAVVPGVRVLVPLGARFVIGVVVSTASKTEMGDLKTVIEQIDDNPVYSAQMLNFTRWIAKYYLCGWWDTLDAALPGGMKPRIVTILRVDHNHPLFEKLSHSEQEELSQIHEQSAHLLKSARFKKNSRKIAGWRKEGILNVVPMLDRRFQGRITEERLCLDADQLPSIKIRAGTKADRLIRLLKEQPSLPASKCKKMIPGITPVIRKLVDQQVIKRITEPVEVSPAVHTISNGSFLTLHQEQASAYQSIEQAIDDGVYRTFLLYGVTGSGKTEIYLHAVRKTLSKGRACLILIPEISLTPQAVERFEARFGSRIAVLHSGLNDKERAAEWWKIKCGECDIVVGARSAVFAPLQNIGLIVVDEEHDTSYKQQETPFYNARDISVKLANDVNAVVILGSATPSIESFYNAQQEKYRLLTLSKRANLKPLPRIEIINLKNEKRQPGAFYLSTILVEALKETLSVEKQALIFLNRRGFAAFLSCKACELPVLCRNCSIAMTWHKSKRRLICHHCGDTRFFPAECESCGQTSFRMEGIGTQRIEQDLKALFPAARFLRMDRDTIQRKGMLEKSIDQINQRTIDFVVGTQLISKGHDFKHIGVVCVILADMSLNFPDFRSSERSFQLISQVSGRAGRDQSGKGLTLIQAYNPDHFAIQTAVQNDYSKFYDKEIELRQALENPPFIRLILIKVSSLDPDLSQKEATRLGERINQLKEKCSFQMMGPIESPIQKINKRYYWQILLKSKKPGEVKNAVRKLAEDRSRWQPTGSTRVSIDVDPYVLV